MLDALEIISKGYPKEIKLNFEAGVVFGNFLNFKIFNLPGKCKPDTTVLRKRFSKYCIIPLYSNTAEPFKLCAGQSYFRSVNSHCSSRSERKRQIKIVELILRKKGFSKAKIEHMKTMAVRKKQVEKEKRKFWRSYFRLC